MNKRIAQHFLRSVLACLIITYSMDSFALAKESVLYAKSHALIIGISKYTGGWQNLPGVEKDIVAVDNALKKQGFVTHIKRNTNGSELNSEIRDFIYRYGKNRKNDNNRLLFYFAGHGHTIGTKWGGERGYFVPADAPDPTKNEKGFLDKALDMEQVMLYAKGIDSKHALFLFDSCFSGALFTTRGSIPSSVSYKLDNPVRQFITSGSAGELVPDVSIFRQQFIQALKGDADGNRDGYVSGTELGVFLQDTVIDYSNGYQHPQYGKIKHPALDKGDFVFSLSKLSKKLQAFQMPPPPDPVKLAGRLQVNVNVSDAKVFLDDKYLGTASPSEPLNASDVSIGKGLLKVEKQGFKPETKQVVISTQDWLQVTFLMEKQFSQQEQEVFREIKRLIGDTNNAFAKDRLITPLSDNAWDYLSRVMKLAPNHAEGLILLGQLNSKLIEAGQRAIKSGNLERALLHQQKSQTLSDEYSLPRDNADRLGDSIIFYKQRMAAQEKARLNRIENLFAQTEKAIDEGLLTAPEQENALVYIEKIIDLKPHNKAHQAKIRQTLHTVLTGLVDFGLTSLKTGDIDKAEQFWRGAQVLMSHHNLKDRNFDRLTTNIASEKQRVAQIQEQRRKILGSLRRQVKTAILEGRLLGPNKDSAVYLVEELMRLSPEEKRSQALLGDVVDRLTSFGIDVVDHGKLSKAIDIHDEILRLARKYNIPIREAKQLNQKIFQIMAKERQSLAASTKQEKQKLEQFKYAERRRREKVYVLLAKLNDAFQNEQFTKPKENNAYDLAIKILEIDPSNVRAREILADMKLKIARQDSKIEQNNQSRPKQVVKPKKRRVFGNF